MKRAAVTLLTIVLCFCVTAQAFDLCDEFDGSSIDTDVWTIATGSWWQDNGQLIGFWPITNANRDVGNIQFTDAHQPSGDFVFEVDFVVVASGENANKSNIIRMRKSYQNSFYLALEVGNGIFTAAGVQSGGKFSIASGDITTLANDGVGDINTVRLERSGNTYTFYLNDVHELCNFDDIWFGGDVKLGLGTYGVSTFERACLAYEESTEPDYYVDGNKIRDRNNNGEEFIIRGLDYGSLAWSTTGEWGDYDMEYMLNKMKSAWNANTIRIALNENYWLDESVAPNYKTTVSDLVNAALDSNLHVILDLHFIGGNGLIDDDTGGIFRMPWGRSIDFWDEVCDEFKNQPRVFFEIYNEPHDVSPEVWRNGGQIGSGYKNPSMDDYEEPSYYAIGMNDLVQLIRQKGASNIIMVGGLDWAHDLSHVRDGYAINDEDSVVYAVHIYEEFGLFPGIDYRHWQHAFGDVAEEHPVVITEFGDLGVTKLPFWPYWELNLDCDNFFTQTLLRYAQERGIGYTGWNWYYCIEGDTECNFAGECASRDGRFRFLLKDWDGNPSVVGRPVQQNLWWNDQNLSGVNPSEWPDWFTYYIYSGYPHFVVFSPVYITVTGPDGQQIDRDSSSIEGTFYYIYETDLGDSSTVVVLPFMSEGIWYVDVTPWEDADPLDDFSIVFVVDADSTVIVQNELVANIPDEGYLYSTLDTGSVHGIVSASGAGLYGVPVDLYDSDGAVVASAATDETGGYCFAALNNGDYSVSISTPLGYQADEETKQITVKGLPHEVNFDLNELEITPSQRSRGYWAHQLHKALQNKPKDYELGDFSRFASLIDQHFIQNQINPVDFFTVSQPADQADSLDALRNLLHMRDTDADDPLAKRHAKAQLMALMLNVVSGKVSQTYEITEDSRSVSQLITYCDMLVSDEIDPPAGEDMPGYDSPWFRYIYANFLLVKANLGLAVPAGMIPEDVIQIAYKVGEQTSQPTDFELGQNYPNPFNPSTQIMVKLPEDASVSLVVYNITGRKVETLYRGELPAGTHTFVWDGSGQASGVYFYRLRADSYEKTRKMILMK